MKFTKYLLPLSVLFVLGCSTDGIDSKENDSSPANIPVQPNDSVKDSLEQNNAVQQIDSLKIIQEQKEKFDEYTKAAKQGNAEAQNNLGNVFIGEKA